jgi:hypothetical protein
MINVSIVRFYKSWISKLIPTSHFTLKLFHIFCYEPARKPIQCWHVDETSTRPMRIAWRNTLTTVHPTLLECAPVHQTPYMCLSTTSWWGATSHEDGYSLTHLYKGDLDPQGMIHFSHTFHTFHLISHTDFSVGVLMCLQTSFVPPRRLVAIVSEHFSSSDRSYSLSSPFFHYHFGIWLDWKMTNLLK